MLPPVSPLLKIPRSFTVGTENKPLCFHPGVHVHRRHTSRICLSPADPAGRSVTNPACCCRFLNRVALKSNIISNCNESLVRRAKHELHLLTRERPICGDRNQLLILGRILPNVRLKIVLRI